MLCVHFPVHKNLECCIIVSTVVTQRAANMVDFFSLMSCQYFCGLSKRRSCSQQRLSARWQANFLATCAPHIVCRLKSSLDSENIGPFIFPRTVSHPNLVKCRAKAGVFALTEVLKKESSPFYSQHHCRYYFSAARLASKVSPVQRNARIYSSRKAIQ